MTPHEYRIAAEELNAQADALAAMRDRLRTITGLIRELEGGLAGELFPSQRDAAYTADTAGLYLGIAIRRLESAAAEMTRRAA